MHSGDAEAHRHPAFSKGVYRCIETALAMHVLRGVLPAPLSLRFRPLRQGGGVGEMEGECLGSIGRSVGRSWRGRVLAFSRFQFPHGQDRPHFRPPKPLKPALSQVVLRAGTTRRRFWLGDPRDVGRSFSSFPGTGLHPFPGLLSSTSKGKSFARAALETGWPPHRIHTAAVLVRCYPTVRLGGANESARGHGRVSFWCQHIPRTSVLRTI
jgi:hypothetical protein